MNEEHKSAQVPYFVHEGEMCRAERTQKRLWVVIITYRGRSYGNGRSYARRRDAMGRYSRGMGDYSGTYPMDYIDPYWDRRF